METIEGEVDGGFGVDYQAVWAAISTFVYLGRIYIWPVEHYDDDLKKVLERARELRATPLREYDEAAARLEEDIAELEQRLANRPGR
jgi:hypothetical protein